MKKLIYLIFIGTFLCRSLSLLPAGYSSSETKAHRAGWLDSDPSSNGYDPAHMRTQKLYRDMQQQSEEFRSVVDDLEAFCKKFGISPAPSRGRPSSPSPAPDKQVHIAQAKKTLPSSSKPTPSAMPVAAAPMLAKRELAIVPKPESAAQPKERLEGFKTAVDDLERFTKELIASKRTSSASSASPQLAVSIPDEMPALRPQPTPAVMPTAPRGAGRPEPTLPSQPKKESKTSYTAHFAPSASPGSIKHPSTPHPLVDCAKDTIAIKKKDLLKLLAMEIHKAFPPSEAITVMRNFDSNEHDGQGSDILLYAAALGKITIFRLALKVQELVHGSTNVEVENWLKITPLIAVCMKANNPRERFAIVQTILIQGGDPIHQDICGNRAIDWANHFGLTEIVALLQKANPQKANPYESLPMHPKALLLPPQEEHRECASKKEIVEEEKAFADHLEYLTTLID